MRLWESTFLAIVVVAAAAVHVAFADRKVCMGFKRFNDAPIRVRDPQERIRQLEKEFSGCEIVEGSLIIPLIPNVTSDFAFLANVTEITDYLYIDGAETEVPLPNLKVVRGENPRLVEFALPGYPPAAGQRFSITLGSSSGITKWPFPSLQQVVDGKVLLYRLSNLTSPDTIDWSDILPNGRADVFDYQVGTALSVKQPDCSSCPGNFCWSKDRCHVRTLKICHPRCGAGSRCRGSTIFDCCDPDCLGGCTQANSDRACSACRLFRDGDQCVDQCPPLVVFDSRTQSFVPTDDGKFIFGDECVAQCPNGTFANGQECVEICPEGRRPENGFCIDCTGPCPKICDAPGNVDGFNVHNFTGCTDIKGSLFFRFDTDLNADAGTNRPQVSQSELEVAFESVRTVSGYVRAGGQVPRFTSMRFLRNLETIGGEELTSGYGLLVLNTGLYELGLESLQSITKGDVAVSVNPNLCLNLTEKGLRDAGVIKGNQRALINRNNASCGNDYCDSQCNIALGCWGQSPSHCVGCVNFDYFGTCVSDCAVAAENAGVGLMYADSGAKSIGRALCSFCHEECAGGCRGPNNDECFSCKNVKNATFCQPNCPFDRYNDTNVCYPCHEACEDGCTGPGAFLGAGGCNNCSGLLILNENETKILECVQETCPDGRYPGDVTEVNSTFSGRTICRRCHPLCTTCNGPGPADCNGACTIVEDAGVCREQCGSGQYENSVKQCKDCPERCGTPGCSFVSGEVQCNPCTLNVADRNGTDFCYENCPDDIPLAYSGRCYSVCPNDTFPNEIDDVCVDCNVQCKVVPGKRTCRGGGNILEENCLNGCNRFEQERFCVSSCDVTRFNEVFEYFYNGTMIYRYGRGPTAAPPPTDRLVEGNPGGEENGEGGETETEEPTEPLPLDAVLIRSTCEVPPTLGVVQSTPSSFRFEDLIGPIIGAVLGFIVVVSGISVVLFFGFKWSEKKKSEMEDTELGPSLDNPMYGGADHFGMMTMKSGPAAVAPTEARLVLVQENSLELLEKLGSGAFGTVYRGTWLPEGETNRLSVAVKVLNEGTGAAASKELLQEAVTMSAIDHPHLVRLLCVCMASRVMLITQLVPLGAMLSYLRKRKSTLTGEALLVFSYQVARGMVYLEQKRLVHRDLAARNVLVQTPMMVKISDFGLSKILDIDEGHFQSLGEKMPIKWLAPESLLKLQFTHKTDVWAFGVTMWEILTFGNQPFKGKKGSEMYQLLTDGERLPHPKVCNASVYAVMLECWDLEPDKRPTFKDLSRQLGRMYKTPDKYVTTEADRLRAKGQGKLQTGTYEMAAAFAEYNAADDDGYDNDAGVTFNPYENPRDCVPGGLYSNAGLGLSSLAEDDEDELDVNPYDNAPTANGRAATQDAAADYDNPVTMNGAAGNDGGQSAYDNLGMGGVEGGEPDDGENENENAYDNPAVENATSEKESDENAYDNPTVEANPTKSERLYDNPADAAEGEAVLDDDMGAEEAYQDPTADVEDEEDGYQDPTADMGDEDDGYQDPTAEDNN